MITLLNLEGVDIFLHEYFFECFLILSTIFIIFFIYLILINLNIKHIIYKIYRYLYYYYLFNKKTLKIENTEISDFNPY